MAEAVVTFLLNQLKIMLSQKGTMLGTGGLQKNFQYISDELGHMKALLKVADRQEESHPQLQEWVNQVREAAYDAEDVMDEFMLHFSSYCKDGYGFYAHIRKIYASFKNQRALCRITHKMQDVKAKVKEVSERHQRYQPIYGIYEQGNRSGFDGVKKWYDSRDNALLQEEEHLVGIKESKQDFLNLLLADGSAFRVHAVAGMGGLGKTTLVKKAFDDEAVKKHFIHRVWVNVSESSELSNLLRKIINQLLKEIKNYALKELEDADTITMKQHIKNLLQDRRYIVVLDDIWHPDTWEAIKLAFPTQNHSSRVLITTRSHEVARAATVESGGLVYDLQFLSPEDSWRLFCRNAFPCISCPPYLEKIAKMILKRCDGLPLAIVVTGSLLATKSDRIEEWEIFYRSYGAELHTSNKLERMTRFLSLSYYDLPDYLKLCFLYMSILPEDYVIEKSRLIRLWTAEGLVEKQEGKSPGEVAESYFIELVKRNLIQVEWTSWDGRERACRVHDILHQIILSMSRKQNITTICSGGNMELPTVVRRLVIHGSSCIDGMQGGNRFMYLRSLIFFGPKDSSLCKSLLKQLSDGYRLLKVLDLGGAELEMIPSEVFKFIHLEYLSLRGTKVEIIPKSIGKLKKLQTLDLKDTNVTELPIQILMLLDLRYLSVTQIETFGFKAPYEIGSLKSLETLFHIEVDVDEITELKLVREIGKLIKLKKLGIISLRREDGKDLCSSLEMLTDLRSLAIRSLNRDEVIDLNSLSLAPQLLRKLVFDMRLERVPEWISSLHALSYLYLGSCGFLDDPLGPLQDLPKLAYLHLTRCYDGEGLYFKAGGFRKLKKLSIWELEKLRWIRVEKGSMVMLENFGVIDCKSMVDLPCGLQYLSNLWSIHLSDTSDELMRRLQQHQDPNTQNGECLGPKVESGESEQVPNSISIILDSWINGEWKMDTTQYYVIKEVNRD